jgi:hypothetical protein
MLKEFDVIEWPFEFWDDLLKCQIRSKLERLNPNRSDVHVIRIQGDTRSHA